MATETLTLLLTIATLVVSSLGVLAIRHGSKHYILAALAALFFIAIAFIAPHYAEAGDLFILWRLMIMAVVGTASLVVLVISTFFGAMIGTGVVLMDVLITRSRTPLPIWFTGPICVLLALAAGIAMNNDATQSPTSGTTENLPKFSI